MITGGEQKKQVDDLLVGVLIPFLVFIALSLFYALSRMKKAR